MDIKWRNRLKLVVWVFLLTFGISSIINFTSGSSLYLKKDYFHTTQFEDQLSQFIGYLGMFELNDIPKKEAKKRITVTPEEIEEIRYRYGDLPQQLSSIYDQYKYQIENARSTGDQEVADIYTAERDRKIEAIKLNFESDQFLQAELIQEKERQIDQAYQMREQQRSGFLEYLAVFTYNLQETTTGNIYTNISTSESNSSIENNLFARSYKTLSVAGSPYYNNYNDYPLESGVFAGQIAIPRSAPSTSPIMIHYWDYQIKQIGFFIYSILGIIAMVGSFIVYRRFAINRQPILERVQTAYDQIPVDVRFLALGISGIAAILLLSSITRDFSYQYVYSGAYDMLIQLISHLLISTIFVSVVWIQGKWLLKKLRSSPKLQAAWRRALLFKGYRILKEAFLMKSVAVQILILLSLVFVFGTGIGVVAAFPEPEGILIYMLLFLVVGIPILWFIVRRVGYYNQIIHHSSELIGGNLETDLPVKGKSTLATLAGNLNTLKYGVKNSQTEKAKSERFKTELITNVSHDLRTPLTSIITYTGLLKQEDLPEADRQAYIDIIENKSGRLKVLIDDLFEASKMASGQIQLAEAHVDLVQLLQQALAECNEGMQQSTLQFRVTTPDVPVMAHVDGQKLWRVFDNLIRNCLNYSLEHTRVYISLQVTQNQAIITFKNVSKYELSENIDELFERFKRGDASRHTEGSGLGLAIAKSIIDLHGGDLDITADGDLFKVTIMLSIVR